MKTPSHMHSGYWEALRSIPGLMDSTSLRDCDKPYGEKPLFANELELQLLWFSGELGNVFETRAGDRLEVLDFGYWNKSAGPDFLGTKFKVRDVVVHGDVEIDLNPSSWESHGHAINPAFNQVKLHVSAKRSEKTVFFRTESHQEVPYAIELNFESGVFQSLIPRPQAQGSFLKISDADIEVLLKEACAQRLLSKSKRWWLKAKSLPLKALLLEAFADVLGYSKNQIPMKWLLHRVLNSRRHAEALSMEESVFLGAAGLLSPDIHKNAPEDTKSYLENLWEEWWSFRHFYEIEESLTIQWCKHGMRPSNHYHRRVATLGLMMSKISTLMKAFNEEDPKPLIGELEALSHPFWDLHYSLQSKKVSGRQRLWGGSRIQAFLVNYWLPYHQNSKKAEAWFGKQKLHFSTHKIQAKINTIFGREVELKYAWQEQGALQLIHDFS